MTICLKHYTEWLNERMIAKSIDMEQERDRDISIALVTAWLNSYMTK